MKVMRGMMVGVIVSVLLCACGVYGNEKNLVAYWSFDEGVGGTLNDKSGNDNYLTIVGEARWVKGIKGFGLLFRGESNAFSENRKLQTADLSKCFSLEAWCFPVKPETGPLNEVVSIGAGEGGWRSLMMGAGGVDHACMGRCFFWYNAPSQRMYAEKVSPNKWIYLVATFDGKNMRFYTNGEPVDEREITVFPQQAEKPAKTVTADKWEVNWNTRWCIGCHFHGIVDEVRVWSRALGEEEVKENFNAIRR